MYVILCPLFLCHTSKASWNARATRYFEAARSIGSEEAERNTKKLPTGRPRAYAAGVTRPEFRRLLAEKAPEAPPRARARRRDAARPECELMGEAGFRFADARAKRARRLGRPPPDPSTSRSIACF